MQTNSEIIERIKKRYETKRIKIEKLLTLGYTTSGDPWKRFGKDTQPSPQHFSDQSFGSRIHFYTGGLLGNAWAIICGIPKKKI